MSDRKQQQQTNVLKCTTVPVVSGHCFAERVTAGAFMKVSLKNVSQQICMESSNHLFTLKHGFRE